MFSHSTPEDDIEPGDFVIAGVDLFRWRQLAEMAALP